MRLPSTTIRDFGGGWNTSDSDLNLSSRFQPISDNVIRGIDGSFSPRQGMGLYCDFRTGSENDLGEVTVDIGVTNTSPKIEITFPTAHGLTSGDHVTISGLAVGVGGIPANEINGAHGILVVDTDTIAFYTTVAASATVTAPADLNIITDDNLLAGNIIHVHFFNRKLLVFTDIGEIGAVVDGIVMDRIWGIAEAEALTPGLVPTRKCDHWSSATFKSTVIACNGYDKDKPLQIFDDFDVEPLVDKATSSNAAVPKADYVVCLHGYVVFLRTEWGDPFVEFSARGTDGTFTRDTNPADSVEVDLSMVTSSFEPVLLGAAPLRDKLYAAFYDKGMIGTIGEYDSNGNHVPNFDDVIAENGTISHRTMVPLGNDVFMCDYAGVPSIAISQQSGVFVPTRVSELIAPDIQAHLSRLQEDTLSNKAYAVFNPNDRTYMLFLPIYDELAQELDSDPFIFNTSLKELNQAIVRKNIHGLFENSYVTVAGATSIGDMDANKINGKRKIVSIIDRDTFVIQLDGYPSSNDDTFGGGDNVTITPINDETIGYIFEFNKEFKIRRWTRYRGWDFDCACSSQRGKVFFAKGLKVYRMGDNETPLYADFIGDYDFKSWEQSTTYHLGDRVRDAVSGSVYTLAVEEYTTPSSGTFEDDRDNNLDAWEDYIGEPINWQMETPWSDMRERGRVKTIKYVNLSTEGYDRFTLSAFVNQIRTDPSSNELAPLRTLDFQAGNTGGWGISNPQVWGSGRRTREEKVWPMSIRGKLLRWRFSGSTVKRVKIVSLTMYYMLGNIR